MNKYKHIFFDLDGTLWDFEKNSYNALTEIFEKHQLEKKINKSHDVFISEYKTINKKLRVLCKAF